MSENEEKVWDKIADYLRNNVTKNVKELMATLGSMILTLLATIIFVLKMGFEISDAFIIILLELQPFCYIYIKLIFSGESHLKDAEIELLKKTLADERQLTEYRIKLVARDAVILSNEKWNELNEVIGQIEAYQNR